MAKEETVAIDSDHEIEEFLQTYIVEKVKSGYEAATTVINQQLYELHKKIDSIKNAGNSTNQDVSVLLQNNRVIIDDADCILKDIKTLAKKTELLIKLQSELKLEIPDETKIAGALTLAWNGLVEEQTLLIQNDISRCFDEIVALCRQFEKIIGINEAVLSTNEGTAKKIREIEEYFSEIKDLIKTEKEDVIQSITSHNQVVKIIDEKATELLENDKMIMHELSNLCNKMKLLWIVIGVDTVIIAGVLIACIFK